MDVNGCFCSKQIIHIISFEPITSEASANSIHELSITSVSIDVIGEFWRATKKELVDIVWIARSPSLFLFTFNEEVTGDLDQDKSPENCWDININHLSAGEIAIAFDHCVQTLFEISKLTSLLPITIGRGADNNATLSLEHKGCNAMYVEDVKVGKRTYTSLLITFLILNRFSIRKKFWEAETQSFSTIPSNTVYIKACRRCRR